MNVIDRQGGTKERQMTFTIDAENNITAFRSQAEAEAIRPQAEMFTSEQELAKLATKWPARRLVEIWNSIPGFAVVRKFTDRKSAVSRIWKAIQTLSNSGAAEVASLVSKRSSESTLSAKSKPTKASQSKRAKTAYKAADSVREGSKTATVLGLLRRKGGATLKQIMDTTGWQAHSVRGFISGALGTKMGLPVESVKRGDGERVYQITS
jgi:hypothetical protein